MNGANASLTHYRWLATLVITVGASVIAAGIGLRIRELVEKVKRK